LPTNRASSRAVHTARSAHHAGGRRGKERGAERSSDWRRGARRAPPTRTYDDQSKRAVETLSASAFRFTWLALGAVEHERLVVTHREASG
jgi:hypothetical protein